MVSDNATIFKSEEFTSFCQDSGIFQKFIAPGHPATNGLAERNIQTLKNKLSAMNNEPSTIVHKIREILFKYRATPLKNGKSPSEQYLGRQIRIRLDALKPTKFKSTSSVLPSRQLSVGDRVQARYYNANKMLWRAGVITKKMGLLHYIVKLDNGYTFKRHINQLLQTSVPNENSTDATPNESFPTHETSTDAIPENQQLQDQQIIVQQYFANNPPISENHSSTSKVPVQQPEGNSAQQPSTIMNQQPIRQSTRQRKPPVRLRDYNLEPS